MTNRYSSLNRRPAAASSLFNDYPGSRQSSSTPTNLTRSGSPYAAPSPYVNANGHANASELPLLPLHSGFRPATPNKKGQYSAAVLEELESQNDNTVTSLLSQKVGQLKQLTIAIGDEIRDSTTLASSVNDQFENAGVRLKGTMRRMLRMAERTGVGWKVWVGFFLALWLLFTWVWLF
ncbi:hypothetical protein DV736_g4313, partial [Chaetothyriales sp. CBS 134916]